MGTILQWALKTVVGRWVTGLLIASLLSGAAYMWYNFKQGLIEQGTQVCVQIINQETMEHLAGALAAEKSARAELTAKLTAAAAVNQTARDRHQSLQRQLTELELAMEEQARTDNEYKEWGDTPLPSGVADRLRQSGAGSDPSPVRDDPD